MTTMIKYQKSQYWRPKRLCCCFRLSVVDTIAYGQFLRAGHGRKPQICRWNCSDICHTVEDISTSGFDGHIAISGCPSMLRLFPDTFFDFGVVENRFKRGLSAHAWNCHPQASIFFFFKVPCTSLQVGPLDRSSPLTAQMTRPGGVYVLFMVSLKKIIFPIFHPKMWKIALHSMVTLNNYNFGIVEDTLTRRRQFETSVSTLMPTSAG